MRPIKIFNVISDDYKKVDENKLLLQRNGS